MSVRSMLSRLYRPRRNLARLGIAVAVLAGAGVFIVSSGAAQASSAVVTTQYGRVAGVATANNHVFKGIPFAAPPVGSLRWRPPEPPASWAGVRDATQFGPRCAQPKSTFEPDGGSLAEDCLSLNVFAPASGSGLPVMVWIHGGSFSIGSASAYDPSELAARNNVIVVTVNYRLGVFGYLSLPGLELENPHHSAGNYGFLDQQAALRWVKGNIAGFGGDRTNVTIFGESAGAAGVCGHLASPQSAGLFQKAIAQSVSCMSPVVTLPKLDVQANSLAYVSRPGLNCGSTVIGQVVSCLRSKSAKELLDSFAVGTTPGIIGLAAGDTLLQSVDGHYLPRSPRTAILTGQFNRVPMLSGSTRDEGRTVALTDFDLAGIPLNSDTYIDAIASILSFALPVGDRITAAVVAAAYPLSAYSTPAGSDPYIAPAHLALGAFLTDLVFACSHRSLDDALNNRLNTVYAYEFRDRNAPFVIQPTGWPLGAGHGLDIGYIFGRQPTSSIPYAGMTADQIALAQRIQKYWANFARTGNPNGSGLAAWPQYRLLTGRQMISLDTGPATTVSWLSFGADHKCALWDPVEDILGPTLLPLLLLPW